MQGGLAYEMNQCNINRIKDRNDMIILIDAEKGI